MFKLGKENIDKVYLGKSPVQKMYLGKTLIFPNEEAAECYAITPSIAQYDGDYPWVWAEDTEKWYRLNNYDEYEQYGIFGDSIEPDRIETIDYYNCEFATGAYYVTDHKAEGHTRIVVDFTMPESIPSGTTMLVGARTGTTATYMTNIGYSKDGVLRVDAGSNTFQTDTYTFNTNTRYIIDYRSYGTSLRYIVMDGDGNVLADKRNTFSGSQNTSVNMGINTMMQPTVFTGFTNHSIIRSVKMYDITSVNENGTLTDDYVFLADGVCFNIVTGYRTNISGGTVTLRDKAGEIETIIKGESTYKGKLSIVNDDNIRGIEYEWNGNKWVAIGESYDDAPFQMQNTGQWITDGTIGGNVVWKSNSNYHIGKSSATDYLIALRDGPLSFYARSNGEAKYDYLTIYYPDTTTLKSFYNSASTSYTLITIPNIKKGEKVKLTYAKDISGDKNEDRAFVYWLEEHIHPKQYEERPAPEKLLIFDSIEEMEAYECAYDKAVAMVGDDAYVYINDNWILVDYSKAIRYTTTDGKPLSNTIAGSTVNVMINEVGYYLFDTTPTSIAASAFTGQTTLKTVDLPEGVTSIGGAAFRNCSKLTNITLPSTLRTIGDGAFQNCSVLQNVTIPEGITTLGLNTFTNCNGFTEVILPDSLTTLNRSSFAHCSNVTHIHLGKNFTTYTTYTDYGGTINSPFVGCNAVTSVTVDDGNTTFVKDNGCSITTVSGQIKQAFPTTTYDKYTSIGDCAFLSVNFGTRAVEIPSGVTQVPQEGFRNITAQSITIPDSVVGEMNGWFRDAKIVNYFIGSGITKAFSRTWTTFDSSDTARRIEFTNAANLTTIFGNTYGLKKINYLRVPNINISFSISFSTAFTKEALKGVIGDLRPQDEGVTKTLTMDATNLAKLTEEEIAIATDKGWIVQ